MRGLNALGLRRCLATTQSYLYIGFCIPWRQIYSPSSFGVVRHRITPETTPLEPITDVVQGLIHGIRIEKLKLDIDVSEQETKKIYSAVLEGFRAIEAAAQ